MQGRVSPMSMSDIVQQARWSGIAACIGGAMYTGKAGVILVGGDQPPLLFEAAPIAFGVSLLLFGGLFSGRLAQAGSIVALVVLIAAVANVLEEILFDRELVPWLSSMIDAISGFGPFVGLLLVGWASRHQWAPLAAHYVGPLAVAGLYPLSILLMVPLAFAVDLDGATGERLIELPILLIGIGWAAFGGSLVAAPALHHP